MKTKMRTNENRVRQYLNRSKELSLDSLQPCGVYAMQSLITDDKGKFKSVWGVVILGNTMQTRFSEAEVACCMGIHQAFRPYPLHPEKGNLHFFAPTEVENLAAYGYLLNVAQGEAAKRTEGKLLELNEQYKAAVDDHAKLNKELIELKVEHSALQSQYASRINEIEYLRNKLYNQGIAQRIRRFFGL